MRPLTPQDRIGLVHPFVDAHTLGIYSVAQLLIDVGLTPVVANEVVCRAAERPQLPSEFQPLIEWVRSDRVTALGFSFRLDPDLAVEKFGKLLWRLKERGLLTEQGGPIHSLYFAGLPAAAERVQREFGDRIATFRGDESPAETLRRFGVPDSLLPNDLMEQARYDDFRLALGRQIAESELPDRETPLGDLGYPQYGTRQDTLVRRVDAAAFRGALPLCRAHVGPYGPNRELAVQEFLGWCLQLAGTGHLDILSIGTSQLSQEAFGEPWGDRPNGGGVPIANEAEFRAVYDASRPMLVRTYAGTQRIPELAAIYESTINAAWHALSYWWFCRTDGRGPLDVRENLRQHVETLRVIARFGKPFEPNIPHHFSFRGGDDITYVVSSVLAARTAKRCGVPVFVLQNMMNTPRSTWGVQDLAKARVLLRLTREQEDPTFRVIYQPRAGLDFFSPDLEKAKAQLASASMLMDDVEPDQPNSPEVIHVVSYSEAAFLATPPVVDESVRLTRAAIREYRRLRKRGQIESPESDELAQRTEALEADVRATLQAIESSLPDPYSADGLYEAFRCGFLIAPYLWECREEFRHAVDRPTRVIRGAVVEVDDRGLARPVTDRLAAASERARRQITV